MIGVLLALAAVAAIAGWLIVRRRKQVSGSAGGMKTQKPGMLFSAERRCWKSGPHVCPAAEGKQASGLVDQFCRMRWSLDWHRVPLQEPFL